MASLRRLRPGELSLLVAASVYGVSTTLSVAALDSVRPVDLLTVELTGASAILLGTAALTGRLRRRGALRQMLLGGLTPGLVYLLADVGLARTSASSGSLLIAVEPLLAVLLAVVFLRERQSGRAIAALAVGVAGSALVALGPGGTDAGTALGDVFVLGAVAASAVFVIATRHASDDSAGSDGLNESAWQTTGGLLCVTPFIAVAWTDGGTRLTTAGLAGWAACLAVVLCGAVGGVAFNRGIGRVPAARSAQLLNLTPVVGTLTAVAVLGERLTAFQLAGGVAILFSLALLLRAEADADPPAADPTEPPVLAASAAGRSDTSKGDLA